MMDLLTHEGWANVERQVIIQEMFEELDVAFDDWREIVESDRYQEWLDSKNVDRLLDKAIHEVNTDLAIVLIMAYKQEVYGE